MTWVMPRRSTEYQSLARSSRKDGRFRQGAGLDRTQIIYRGDRCPNRQNQVFEGPELTADHVMASACSYLFQAVEIGGVPYWDGGYMGNPALFPLFYKTACPDIVVVQVNPIERDEVPRSAHQNSRSPE
jgi:NTE family protein